MLEQDFAATSENKARHQECQNLLKKNHLAALI
jgi:hypothetical protein